MNARRNFRLITQVCGLALISSTVAAAQFQTEPVKGYAETIYSDYQRFAGEKISFNVSTRAASPIGTLGLTTIRQLLGINPYYGISYGEGAVDIHSIRYSAPNEKALSDLGVDTELKTFAEDGYPLELGFMRQLTIDTWLENERRTHTAVELCWPKLGRCFLVDGAIPDIANTVLDIRRELVDGWEFKQQQLISDAVLKSTADKSSGACRIEGQTSRTYINDPKNGFTKTAKDARGRTMYHFVVPNTDAVVSCVSSPNICKAAGRIPNGQPFDTTKGNNPATGWTMDVDKLAKKREGEIGSARVVTGGAAAKEVQAYLTFDLNWDGWGYLLDINTNGRWFAQSSAVSARCRFI